MSHLPPTDAAGGISRFVVVEIAMESGAFASAAPDT